MKKERPILFSAPMVRAILDGRKTQTRRVVKPQPEIAYVERNGGWLEKKKSRGGNDFLSVGKDGGWLKFPYGGGRFKDEIIGTRLWVRETWQTYGEFDKVSPRDISNQAEIQYPATYDGWVSRKRSPLHMPRWASRIDLLIKNIRVDRLQDISDEDAIAEGVTMRGENNWSMDWPDKEPKEGWHSISNRQPHFAFANFISSLHGGKNWNLWYNDHVGERPLWDQNPWVWVIEFERVKQ